MARNSTTSMGQGAGDLASGQPLLEPQEVEFLITEEVAEYLRTTVGSIRNATSNGKIPPHCYRKFGRRILYIKSELTRLVLEGPTSQGQVPTSRNRQADPRRFRSSGKV